MLGKLLGIMTIGKAMTDRKKLRTFIFELAIGASLTVLSGLMLGALMIGGFFLLYQVLLAYGMLPNAAMVAVGTLAVLITAGLVATTVYWFRRVFDKPNPLSDASSPIASGISGLLNAFMEGFLTHPPRRTAKPYIVPKSRA
jgi:uncharacterized membrane protein YfcA